MSDITHFGGESNHANISRGPAIELGEYIVENGATVRSAAKKFGISKSTLHTAETKWNGSAGVRSREETAFY